MRDRSPAGGIDGTLVREARLAEHANRSLRSGGAPVHRSDEAALRVNRSLPDQLGTITPSRNTVAKKWESLLSLTYSRAPAFNREPDNPRSILYTGLIIFTAQEHAASFNIETFSEIYSDLRRIAAARLRLERSNVTLQPTSLAHEAYVRLAGSNSGLKVQNREHFSPCFYGDAANTGGPSSGASRHQARRKC